MISVKKVFTNAPASLSHSNCLAKVEASIKNKSYQKSDWYKKEDTKVALKEIYNNKCAYCEGFSAAQAPFPVEHYRPKGKVTVFVSNKIIDVSNHNGYYWLAYEWSNLLWSCYWCNQHKASQFTLEDETQRVFQPTLNVDGDLIKKECLIDADVLLAEKPLLLNPEIDKAEDHFYFLPNGEIKSVTNRGKETIRICELDREDLCLARRKLADDIFKEITTEVTDF